MDWLRLIHRSSSGASAPRFGTGDDVRVWFKILEQGKERLGQFEGIVIRVRGAGSSKTFTVRRMTHGVGVERVFPFDAPIIDRVDVLRSGKVKRSRLYYLRHVVKKTRLAAAEGPETNSKGAAAEPTEPALHSGKPTAPEAALAKAEPPKS